MTLKHDYTVALLRPYYGETQTYLAHVTAENAKKAVDAARREMIKADGGTVDDAELEHYVVLYIFEGHLSPIAWR